MISDELVDFVAAWEGFKASPSRDPLVPGVWDVGHGFVLTQADRDHPILGRFFHPDGRINEYATLTRDEARTVLQDELEDYAQEVADAADPFILSQNELDACTSLAYNVGVRAFRESSLARRLREGNPYAAFEDEMPRWHRAGGRVVPGLLKRRRAEQRIAMDAEYGGRP
jgi:lysozyme